jgi:hypothetical protein
MTAMKNTTPAFSVFRIIHRVMFIGQILFLVVLFFLVNNKMVSQPLAKYDKIFQVIAIAFSAIAFFAGNALFKKKLLAVRDNVGSTVQEKFEKYRPACMIQWALLEGAVLFCGICFFLTGNFAFLALAGVLLLLFMMQMPDKNKMALQLGLNMAEVDEL